MKNPTPSHPIPPLSSPKENPLLTSHPNPTYSLNTSSPPLPHLLAPNESHSSIYENISICNILSGILSLLHQTCSPRAHLRLEYCINISAFPLACFHLRELMGGSSCHSLNGTYFIFYNGINGVSRVWIFLSNCRMIVYDIDIDAGGCGFLDG